MTSINIQFFRDAAVQDSNLEHNDYAYYSGWNRTMQLGQQYLVGPAEAKELTYEISKDAWFKDPMLPDSPPMDLRAVVLAELQLISTPKAAREMPKGSIRVTRAAAEILNAYAKELGSDIKFTAHWQYPTHPVG